MPPTILVSRIDRIGDVVLTLPLCGLLKARTGARIAFLARRYTRDVVSACDAVDEVLEWDDAAGAADARDLIARARADVVLHVRPNAGVARAAARARVPVRIGTNRRVFHWLYCNRLVSVARRASALHEAQLNVRLAASLLDADALALSPAALAPYGRITPRVAVPAELAPLVAPDRVNVVVHPTSGGSAREWPLAKYAALIAALPASDYRVLVTGTAAEGASLGTWLRDLPPHAHDVTGRTDVAALIALLGAADGFVGASTGPLHLAAAVGIHALGLFPHRRPMHPGRWAPIGPRSDVLVAESPCAACRAGTDPCTCVEDIAVDAVRARIARWVPDRAARSA
jgi:ADP-heptose:LPS heptosyltransferase